MPHRPGIEPHEAKGYWRVIVPTDLSKKRQTKWFRSKAEALKFCDRLMAQRGDIGSRFFSLKQIDQAVLMKALEEAGGKPENVAEAVRLWKIHQPDTAVTVQAAIDLCVQTKAKSGKSKHYLSVIASNLKLFAIGRAAVPIHEIKTSDVQAFIDADPDWSPHTRKTYLRDVVTLFSFCVKNGYLTSNPALAVEKPTMPDEPPLIVTPEEAETLMRTAEQKDRGLLVYLSLCLFGGLRPSEAIRFEPEDRKAEHIEVFGKRARSRNRRLVPVNETLKAWLDSAPPLDRVNFPKRLVALRKAAGIPWGHDILRHSFISYRLPFSSVQDVARESGNSEAVIFQHYREVVSKEAAGRFWKVRPRTKSLAG